MTSEVRAVARWRPTPLLMTAVAMQVAAVAFYGLKAVEPHVSPVWGWLPGIVITVLTAISCRHAAATPRLDAVSARLLRSIGTVAILVGLGTAGDARESITAPARVTLQQHDPITSL